MPWRDGGPTDSEIASALRSENRFLEATLCGILSAGFDLSLVNWQEAGVKEVEVTRWWLQHRIKDEKRKAREKELKEKELADKIRQREQLEREIQELSKNLSK